MNSACKSPAQRLRILVLGYIVRWPLGGMVWSNLHYLMGLHALGHEVWYFEDSDDYPSCYDPERCTTDTNRAYGLRFAEETLGRIGLGKRWAFHDGHAHTWHGPVAGRALRICQEADLVLNLACANPLRPWMQEIPVRAYVDEDPAFTQIRALTDEASRRRALAHNVFFTFGENLPAGKARIPMDGLPWRPARQPVFLPAVPVSPPQPAGQLTTVMQWQSYKPVEYQGIRYGLKGDSFAEFFSLPQQTGPLFELALGGRDVPAGQLRSAGWRLRNPLEVTRTPWTYEAFIRESKAEFGLAKHGYVASHSGWFSERSACYLATGRPVLAQETGFSEWLDARQGVLSFQTKDDLVAAVEELNGDYERHCRVAREIAVEYFDSAKILPAMLERCHQESSRPSSRLS